MQGNKN